MLLDTRADTLPAPHSLYITGLSQCPRVDIPHLASIAGTLSAVAGRDEREVAQVVWNYLCCRLAVSQGYVESEIRNDVHNQFLVVELV